MIRTLLLLASVLSSPLAHAQEDVGAAARAYEQGQAAQLREDYAQAADLFELAHRLAPSSVALRSAMRNHLAAGHRARAATLALTALRNYTAEADTRSVAEEALQARDSLALVRLRCPLACTPTLDGRALTTAPVEAYEAFLDPGTHAFNIQWEGRPSATHEVEAIAGSEHSLTVDAPEPDPVDAPVDPPVEPDPIVNPPPLTDNGGGGLHPWLFLTALGVTAVLGGITLWSGLDTLSARDDYEAAPTRQGFEDGVDLERRTNILIGTTIGFGVISTVLLFLTDWGGDGEPQVGLQLRPGGFGGTLTGRL
ncbi:MAG: hypothetical protein AAGF12_08330 [Myxococcota bacterium]